MLRYFVIAGTLAIALLVIIHPAIGQTQPTPAPAQPSPAAIEAGKLFQSQKWPEALIAFEALTKTEPTNGMAWYRLGASLGNLNKHQEAVAPLKKAVEILQGPQAMYLLGSTYARLNDKDKAFESLTQAVTAGFAALLRLENDASLASLREDPRYQKLVESVRRKAFPCHSSEKARQLDFWVGEWDVQVNGQTIGTNVIQRLEEGCLILENWKGNGGLSGKSMNFFNPILGTWRQTYMSSNQMIWEMTGEYKDGALHYSGQVFTPGGIVMTRVTFFNLEAGRLRHTEDNSRDGGKTWNNVWDAIYVRKSTSQKED
jgi:hypothetical protein